uniref:Uncharacterized protein n=1 Tax=Romanomermis culicivorax TaxID=13658 RepID=A0A915KQ96_ROMCU
MFSEHSVEQAARRACSVREYLIVEHARVAANTPSWTVVAFQGNYDDVSRIFGTILIQLSDVPKILR